MPSWIDESAFLEAVAVLKQHAEDALNESETRRKRNVVDPFLSLLIASTFGVENPEELIRLQQVESAMRGMSGALGVFHQTVLASVSGWENHDALYDLKCPERRIVAEVKNKWNTMNAANRRQVETDLGAAIRSMRGRWTAYLVVVIPRKPNRYEKVLASNITEIDGASFYQLATGFPNAIHDLFDELSKKLAPSEDIAAYCMQIQSQSLPPRI